MIDCPRFSGCFVFAPKYGVKHFEIIRWIWANKEGDREKRDLYHKIMQRCTTCKEQWDRGEPVDSSLIIGTQAWKKARAGM